MSCARIGGEYRTVGPSGRVCRVNHLLRIEWRPVPPFATNAACTRGREMTVESLLNLISVALGFAVAGSFATGYQLLPSRLPSFSQLNQGVGLDSLASVPVLGFAAPFLIMRNTIYSAIRDGRRFEFVFMATLIAGFWSLLSGTIVVATLRAVGHLFA